MPLSAIALELLSWASLWSCESPAGMALTFGLAHAAAAGTAAWGALGPLSPQRRAASKPTGLFLFAAAFCLPFVGVPAVALCLMVPSQGPTGAPEHFRVIEEPAWPETGGPAEALDVLGNEPLAELRQSKSAERRLALLLSTRYLGGDSAVRLQGCALKDPSDEVRLLAYGFLEARERDLSARIQALTQSLERTQPELRGSLHLERAQYGWELVFLGFAQGELGTHVMHEARAHAQQAVRLLPERGAPCLLLARLLLHMGETEEASKALEEATRRGLAPEAVAPYAAEAAFRERRFNAVRTALASMGPLSGMRPRLERLEAFWR
ncbi:tetratricopeptide repeat protein [Stigmatella aurantiaca]|uniref:tetratricopeptide repeat protein n=1 Tax=Stigmatella aurantiaca TaxID=41 RepID=UPI0011D22D6A|nr:tetratricopeptide repeat protein [Stigmatella aurantiaca]